MESLELLTVALCSHSHEQIVQCLAAFGMGGEWSLGVALVMEAWPRDKQPLLAGIIGAAANVGFALIAVVGLWFKVTQDSWRWVMVAGAAPALLALLVQWFVPESEKWKESVKKEGTARPVQEIFSSPLLTKTLLAIAFASIALIGTWGSVQWLPLWADQLTGGKMPHAKATTQILSGVGAIAGCLIGAVVAGKFGRRPAYFALSLDSLLFGKAGIAFGAVTWGQHSKVVLRAKNPAEMFTTVQEIADKLC